MVIKVHIFSSICHHEFMISRCILSCHKTCNMICGPKDKRKYGRISRVVSYLIDFTEQVCTSSVDYWKITLPSSYIWQQNWTEPLNRLRRWTQIERGLHHLRAIMSSTYGDHWSSPNPSNHPEKAPLSKPQWSSIRQHVKMQTEASTTMPRTL